MTDLIVENLCKRYGSVIAAQDVTFTVSDGEFLTLLGPSGCGKSTTLSAIAGLDVPTSGRIRAGSQTFYDSTASIYLPPEARNCGLVFQSYALWPHLTVGQNIAFPLRLRRVSTEEQKRRIGEVLDLVEMTQFIGRFPHELSGGQQQRVALARTLVYRPAVLLLDEPLSNLDAKLRERARAWLSHIQHQVRLTTVYVTHDQLEALALSDRIAVMNGGRIAQLASPNEIYESPSDPFVADFIGTSSFFQGVIETPPEGNEPTRVRLGNGDVLMAASRKGAPTEGPVVVAIRPERIRLLRSPECVPDETGTTLPARIIGRSYLGARFQYEVDVGNVTARVETMETFTDSDIRVWIPVSGCIVFPEKEPRRET